jgi:hypothetical protein
MRTRRQFTPTFDYMPTLALLNGGHIVDPMDPVIVPDKAPEPLIDPMEPVMVPEPTGSSHTPILAPIPHPVPSTSARVFC